MWTTETYRKKVAQSEDCVKKYEASFIRVGASATTIHIIRLDADREAGIVLTDKEGPDTNLIFTYVQNSASLNLLKGDYYIWKTKKYLVYEDVDIVIDTIYQKQKSYQCNVEFTFGDNVVYGYYINSLQKYLDTTLENKINITDTEKPILIIPQVSGIENGTKIIIDNKPFKIIDYDNITNKGIMYCSLTRDFISKQEDIVKPVVEHQLTAGIETTMDIFDGYFVANRSVDIISKSSNTITFVVPYGLTSIEITTKNTDESLQTITYTVVE